MVARAHRIVILAVISTSLLLLIAGSQLWENYALAPEWQGRALHDSEAGHNLPGLKHTDDLPAHPAKVHDGKVEAGAEHAEKHGEHGHGEHVEHGEHGEHGHGEHGHEEHEVTPLVFTVAVLIAAFLFADVGLLYLVNYRDENIRSSIYKMISATMSIFLAVTLNAAMSSFLLEQVLAGKEGRGFGLDVHTVVVGVLTWDFLVGMGCFLSALVFVNVMCYRFREGAYMKHLYPLRIIGGHITAFAGIMAFGTLQIEAGARSVLFKHHHYLVVIIAMFSLAALRAVSKRWRNWMVGGREVELSKEGKPTEQDEWRVEVVEAEDDATCLILSFLITQLVIWRITGKLIPLHSAVAEELHPVSHIQGMSIFAGIASGCLALAVVVRNYFQPRDSWKDYTCGLGGEGYCLGLCRPNDPTFGYMRMMNNLQLISAMSMSWSALMVGFWSVQRLLHGTLLDNPEMVKVATAGLLTIIVIVLVILLDVVADWFAHERKHTNANHDVDVSEHVHKNAERIIRTLVDAYGLLVGLCWEKATDAALEVIVEGDEWCASHKVISKCVFAAIIVSFMFTAWIKYIVPSARKHPKHHKGDLLLEDMTSIQDQSEMAAKDHAKLIRMRMTPQLDKSEHLASELVKQLQVYVQERQNGNNNSNNKGSYIPLPPSEPIQE